MRFERGLFAEGWHVLTQCLPYVALAIGGEYVIQVLKEVTGLGTGATLVASVLIWAYLAYAAHAAVLLPEGRDKSLDGKRIFGFALRTFGLSLMAIIPVIVLLVLVIVDSVESDKFPDLAILALLLVGSALWLLVLGLLGTLLPAFVADRKRGMGAAFARGRRQFFWIFGRLLIGPGLLFGLSLSIALLPVWFSDSDGDLLMPGYLPDPLTTGPALLAYAVQTYATVLAAVVLSRAFLRDEVSAAGQAD